MNFSKISKFFASGLVLSSFCFANAASEIKKGESAPAASEIKKDEDAPAASEIKKDEDAPAAVEVKAETPKSDGNVATNSEVKSETVKGENGENQEADSASTGVNLGFISVKSSEASFFVDKLANGIYVVRDAAGVPSSDVPYSENSDVVSRTKVYTKQCVQVYNIFCDPSGELVAQPVGSSATGVDEKSSAASTSQNNADKTSQKA